MKKDSSENSSHLNDCVECRITGFLTLTGVSVYAQYLKIQTPLHNTRHRLFYTVFSTAFAGMAIARAAL